MYYDDDFMYEMESSSYYGKRQKGKYKKVSCGWDDWDYCKGKDERSHRGHHDKCYCCCDKDFCGRCKGCACEQLKELPRNTQVFFTTGEAIFLQSATFIRFDKKTCCATLRVGTADIIVDCRDIKVLLIRTP